MNNLIDKLEQLHRLKSDEWKLLIGGKYDDDYLHQKADEARRKIYGDHVFIRGLIEISSYCKNDCFYCGIRCSNSNSQRYRLTKEQILGCCSTGYKLGFRTFVLQGGEDLYYSDQMVADIIKDIKRQYPDCAVTLSLGEKRFDTYKLWFDAGADRYLLRHETADKLHYEKIHPDSMSFENRMECLQNLRKIGYQVGCGFMVESPYQTDDCLVKDMEFISSFQPDMIGIGPFIPHKDTIYASKNAGTVGKTLRMISLLRLACPDALIPATTALGTIDPQGRELGLQAGANVVMPNLSPLCVRKKYALYDNKICTSEEAAECIECLKMRVKKAGYNIVVDRGDRKKNTVL